MAQGMARNEGRETPSYCCFHRCRDRGQDYFRSGWDIMAAIPVDGSRDPLQGRQGFIKAGGE